MALIQCPICHDTVSDRATICPHCGNAIVKPQYRVRYRDYVKSPVPEALRPKSYMVHSILLGLASFILFTIWCLPFAVASFIYANKVDNLWNRGDIDGAVYASQSARKWYLIGLWLGIVSWLIILFIVFCIIIAIAEE